MAEGFRALSAAYPELAAEFTRRVHGELPGNWRESAGAFATAQAAKGETVATRKASQMAIEAYAKTLPELLGGSADLTGSVLTNCPAARRSPARARATTSIRCA